MDMRCGIRGPGYHYNPALTLSETGSHRRTLSRGGEYQLMTLKDRSGYNGEQMQSIGVDRRDQLGREARDDVGPEEDDSSGAPEKWWDQNYISNIVTGLADGLDVLYKRK